MVIKVNNAISQIEPVVQMGTTTLAYQWKWMIYATVYEYGYIIPANTVAGDYPLTVTSSTSIPDLPLYGSTFTYQRCLSSESLFQ